MAPSFTSPQATFSPPFGCFTAYSWSSLDSFQWVNSLVSVRSLFTPHTYSEYQV